MNDADVQACASVEGKGFELVLTLGTGVGTAVFSDGTLPCTWSCRTFLVRRTATTSARERRAQEGRQRKWSKSGEEGTGLISTRCCSPTTSISVVATPST